MPRGDGTGPMGMGPMTGRGAGTCAGYGCGYGRGFRRMFYAGGRNTDADERELLKSQASLLENRLHDIKKRLASFEDGTAE